LLKGISAAYFGVAGPTLWFLSWEAHSREQSLRLDPGDYTVRVQVGVTAADVFIGIDDWHFTVEQYDQAKPVLRLDPLAPFLHDQSPALPFGIALRGAQHFLRLTQLSVLVRPSSPLLNAAHFRENEMPSSEVKFAFETLGECRKAVPSGPICKRPALPSRRRSQARYHVCPLVSGTSGVS
jgi:hypothetical protein